MTIRDIAIRFGYDVDKASEKKANDSVKALKNTATKLLGAVAVVFSIKGLANLAEAAADAEALKSQFTSVFGDMEGIATDSLKSIASETGVAINRIRGSFTQLASFAKTTGMNTVDAMSLSERAMRAVADSAAFYDKSIEDVTVSLQSFLKGNFAVDAVLGLSATETTRNAAANALYGKSFKELAEDQKQIALLKMVEDANALSGALGQAARESDTWGNHLGNLKQGIADLKAALGGSFLKPAVQVLKLMAQLIGILTEGITELTKEGRFLNKVFNRLTEGIKKTQVFVDRFVKRVGGAEQVVKLLAITAGALFVAMNAGKILTFLKAMGAGLKSVNMKMVALVAVFIIIGLLIDDLINFMSGNNSLMGELFKKFGVDGEAVKETIRDIIDAAKSLLPWIIKVAKNIGGFLLDVLKQLLPPLIDLLKKIIPPLVSFIKRLVPLLMDTGKKILTQIFDTVKRIIPLLIRIVEAVLPVIIGLVERLLPFLLQIIEAVLPVALNIIESLLPLLFSIVEAVLPVILNLIETLIPILLQIVDTILPLVISLIEAVLPLVMEIINAVLPIIIGYLEQAMPYFMELISSVLPIILELITALLPIIFDIVQTLLPVLLELITAVLPILMPIIDLVASLAKSLLPPLVSLLDAILPILKPILSILGPIADILAVIIEAVSKVVGWIAKGFTWVVDLFTGGKTPDVPTDSSGNPVKGHARGTNRTADTFIAGEEGPELITGARGRKVFTNAATGNIFQTLRDIASMGASPRAETVAATASSVENRSITQNIDITNQFNGDRAGQQKSAAAMDKAADDATAYMARGLAYGR